MTSNDHFPTFLLAYLPEPRISSNFMHRFSEGLRSAQQKNILPISFSEAHLAQAMDPADLEQHKKNLSTARRLERAY